MQALGHANVIRAANALVTAEIREAGPTDGLAAAAVVLREMPGYTGAIPIWRLLTCIPRFGDVKAGKAMRRAGILIGSRRVRDLSVRQRLVIAEWLDFEVERRENLGHWRG